MKITGVKIVGIHPQNGKRFPDHVLKSAVRLFEGAKVNADHEPGKPRKLASRIGVLRNVRFANGGLIGDLKYNPHKEAAAGLEWNASQGWLNFAIDGTFRFDGADSDGSRIVSEILAVRSVDLVEELSTTSAGSLESHSPAKIDAERFIARLTGRATPGDSLNFARRLKQR